MTRVVYTSTPQLPLARLIQPQRILRDLLRHRELIVAYTRREFQTAHRGTYLGLVWTVLSPLIMLALFTLVFGVIFGGKFNPKAHETPAEFALALFIGLGFFNAFAQSMGAAGGLVTGNAAYVKSLAFPLEILPLASVLNALLNLAIALAICFTAHLFMYGFLHWTVLWLPIHVVCIVLLGLGISWFLASLSVFIRDIPAVVPPISMVLMFVSGCFFPLSVMSPRMRWLAELNPLAVIIDQSRGALMYGQSPDPFKLAYVLVFAVVFAIAGYAFFMKAKPAFADVI
jgi:homopolymeric O-antigen transport system permease protein